MDSQIPAELYILIVKFLRNGPCQESAKILSDELDKHKLLPKRYDWLGNQHDQTTSDVERQFSFIAGDQLLDICQRLCSVLNESIPPSIPGLTSLLGTGKQSLLRKEVGSTKINNDRYSARRRGFPLSDPYDFRTVHNIIKVLRGRENSGPITKRQGLPPSSYLRIHLHKKTVGHLSAVYCLLFDQTGHYIFTGADDLLVKVWSTQTGRLLATLRGASAEITDIAVNVENTLIAAGSLDRILRVWCLQTTAPVAVLNGHVGMITGVNFCPGSRGDFRYLASTSTDGSVAFWVYTYSPIGHETDFQRKPIMYNEKMRPGRTQMICASFSPGGTFMAAGSADQHVRVYKMTGGEGPTRILEVEAHTDRVDSIQWANCGLRFVSGSKDGTAHVWRFHRQKWKSILLNMTTKLPGATGDDDSKTKPKVSMVAWNRNDELIITAVHDSTLKVWQSRTGKLVKILKGHRDEVFVIEAHPFDPNIILSAGHDGQIFIWDINKGASLMQHQNTIDGQGHGAVFDAKWSPDGTQFAATDSHGNILMFGFNSPSDQITMLPTELFFHTDYRPLIYDAEHGALDEQTQSAPHLMPPPFLVDMDGSPYPPDLQRLVPGREACQEDQLVPNIVTGNEGEREVQDSLVEPRSSIDQMIQALEIRRSGLTPRPPIRGPRYRGDTEGVRLSSGNWESGPSMSWTARTLLPRLPGTCIDETRRRINEHAALEMSEYERQMSLPVEISFKPENSNPKPKRGGRRGKQGSYQTRAAREEHAYEDPDNLNLTASTERSGESSDSTANTSDLSSSDSDSDSTEYSDWIADHGVSLEPPKRSRRKPVPRKTSPLPMPTPKKKNKEPDSSQASADNIKEVPAEFQPTKWLSEVVPRKAPYYPQMGDEVMLFNEGYQLYLEAVRAKQVYKIVGRQGASTKYKLPEPVSVKVIGIKYEIRPPRLCCLRLAVLSEDGLLTGQFFNIKYHDMADVIDFIVLKQTYDLAMQRKWKPGDRFRCMIDDNWWEGTIVDQRPYNEAYPDSPFLSYITRWDNGEDEPMSPWDMEPVSEGRSPDECGGSVPVLPEETETLLYSPQSDEWPNSDRDSTCRRILAGLETVMTLAIAEPFLVPVDLNMYPSYAMVVEYPTDLSTIKARFENRFYRRLTAAQFDVRYLATNAEKFNERHSSIIKQARIVTDLCLKIIKDREDTDVNVVYHQLVDTYQSSSSEAGGDSGADSNQPGPSTRVKKITNTTSRNSDWRVDCLQLLNQMWSMPDSVPFRQAVDILEFPDYLQIIDTPMDLTTVREELACGNYKSPRDFYKDVRLIFANSKNYNTNKKSRIFSMTVRLSSMFEARMKQIMLTWKSTRRRMILQAVRSRKKRISRPGPSRSTSRPKEDSKIIPETTNHNDDDDDDDSEDHLDDHLKLSTLRNNYLKKEDGQVNGFVSNPIRLNPSVTNSIKEDSNETEDDESEKEEETQNKSLRSKQNGKTGDSDDGEEGGSAEKVVEEEEEAESSAYSPSSGESYKINGTRPKKKIQTRNKGKQHVKYKNGRNESETSDTDDEPLQRRPTRKKRKKPDSSDYDGDAQANNRRKRRRKAASHYKDSDSSERGNDSDSDAQTSKRQPRRRAARRYSDSDSSQTNQDSESEEVTKSRRPRRKAACFSDSESSDSESENKSRRPRRKAAGRFTDSDLSRRRHDSGSETETRNRRPRRNVRNRYEDSDTSRRRRQVEDSDSDYEVSGRGPSISSRGRVRKLTERARAMFHT